MGSFCPVAGTRNPHRDCNFAESLVETVPKSLRHSCRSELTRQGISLILLLVDRSSARRSSGGLVVSASLPASPQGSDHLILFAREEGRRMASEDSQDLGWFPILPHPKKRTSSSNASRLDSPCTVERRSHLPFESHLV